MNDNTQPPVEMQPEVLGELLSEEMEQVVGLKRQADNIVHQMGVNRVNEHRLIEQLKQIEGNTNSVLKAAGKRLCIPDGTPWSVTSEGKAIRVGPKPIVPNPMSIVPDLPKGGGDTPEE